MSLTKDGKRDLESEVLARCVKAITLRGRGTRRAYHERLGTMEIARVLRYLKDRFGIRE